MLILGFFFFGILTMSFVMPTWALVVISLSNDISVMATSLDSVSAAQPNVLAARQMDPKTSDGTITERASITRSDYASHGTCCRPETS
jgi:hypothetical protein